MKFTTPLLIYAKTSPPRRQFYSFWTFCVTMSRTGAKRWCFTINNPCLEDIRSGAERSVYSDAFWENPSDGVDNDLDNWKVKYIIVQLEKGENETIHWQGFIMFAERRSLSWLKTHLSYRAHWEVARGSPTQAAEYCRKDDTHIPMPVENHVSDRFEWGEIPGRKSVRRERQEEEDDATESWICSLQKKYTPLQKIPAKVVKKAGFVSIHKALTADVLGPFRPQLKIITMVGPPGTGKSWSIQQVFPGHGRCICGNNGVWFQNPMSDVMVFEEFCGQIQLQRMLQFLDPYPLALEVKGLMYPACYTTVVITSNTRPDGWYKKDEDGEGKRSDALNALYDRLGFSAGDYIPVRHCGTYLELPTMMNIEDARKWFGFELLKVVRQETRALECAAAAARDFQEAVRERMEIPDEMLEFCSTCGRREHRAAECPEHAQGEGHNPAPLLEQVARMFDS